MTLEELEATEWAMEFKEEAPDSYAEAIRLAQNKKLRVEINRTDETGNWVFALSAIVGDEYTGFWMDAKPTKKAAIDLCRRMGWRIAR